MFERTVIPDGPRVISARLPASRSVSVAAYVLAGSRLERPGEEGAAHFMEHITFKGTADFPTARSISEAIEGVGGSFNAATDRESTVYWVRVPRRETGRATHVLGELITRPTLEEREIDQERAVIVEEIRSYMDDPAEQAQMLFQLALFGNTPLGREICGEEDGIRALPARTIHDFWQRAYRPSNVVVAVAGDLPHEEAVALVAAGFGCGPKGAPGGPFEVEPAPALPAGERYLRATRDTAQASLILGLPALGRDHPDSWAMTVLNTVLGEGMSCRLFQGVREEKGLAYDVGSGIVDYADCGALSISAGVDPTNLRPALEAILVELARLRDTPVPADELDKAKRFIAGGLELRMEETRHVASWIGNQEALHDRVLTIDEAIESIERVDADEVRALAERLFRDELLRLSVVAPARYGRGLEGILTIPA